MAVLVPADPEGDDNNKRTTATSTTTRLQLDKKLSGNQKRMF
jgi:hypothetical protein